jgi:hypothetical protein
MRRSIFFLMLGILCAAVAISTISVYVFHDVDQDMIGHWNLAFAGLCEESGMFALIIAIPVSILTYLGRHALNIKSYAPRAKLALILGIGVTVLQYPWEFAARKVVPQLADSAISIYLIVAIVACTFILLRDTVSQRKLRETPIVSF